MDILTLWPSLLTATFMLGVLAGLILAKILT